MCSVVSVKLLHSNEEVHSYSECERGVMDK